MTSGTSTIPTETHRWCLWNQTRLVSNNSRCNKPNSASSTLSLYPPPISSQMHRTPTHRQLPRPMGRVRRVFSIPACHGRHRRTSSKCTNFTITNPTSSNPSPPRVHLKDISTTLPTFATTCTANLRISIDTSQSNSSIRPNNTITMSPIPRIRIPPPPPTRRPRRRRTPPCHTTRTRLHNHTIGSNFVEPIRTPWPCHGPSHWANIHSTMTTPMPKVAESSLRSLFSKKRRCTCRRRGSRLGSTLARPGLLLDATQALYLSYAALAFMFIAWLSCSCAYLQLFPSRSLIMYGEYIEIQESSVYTEYCIKAMVIRPVTH